MIKSGDLIQTQVLLAPAEKRAMQIAALELHTSLSAIIRGLVREFLEKREGN